MIAARNTSYRLMVLLTLLSTVQWVWAVRYQDGDFVFDCNYNWNQLTATLMRYTGTSRQVVVPDSVIYLGNTYPVLYIGDDFSTPFLDNAYAEEVRLPDCAVSVGPEAFNNCQALVSVDLGRNMESIGDYAFGQCPNLKHIVMHNKLTDIGAYAMSECSSLKEVTLGRSVRHLGNGAFNNTQLHTLTLLNTTPAQVDGRLSHDALLYLTCTLVVHIGYKPTFQSASEWSRFRNMVERAETGDLTEDGLTDVSDLNVMLNMMLNRIEVSAQADLTQDGKIDISDINALINILLGLTDI